MTAAPEKVESVARALYEAQCGPLDSWLNLCMKTGARNRWDRLARAAIKAHEAALADAGLVIVPREPTEAMKLAGARSIRDTMGHANHTMRAGACHQAMLKDTLMAESGGY